MDFREVYLILLVGVKEILFWRLSGSAVDQVTEVQYGGVAELDHT
jgi:hypothetical protein